jgi:hypothetical protein
MPSLKIMDPSGHSTLQIGDVTDEKANVLSIADAEQRFKQLTGRGFLPVQPSGDGTPGKIVRQFDPTADIVFQPQLQGG